MENALQLAIIFAMFAPLFLAFGIVSVLDRVKGEHRKKSPFSRKVSRYPGYSLSERILDLQEKMFGSLFVLILFPCLLVTFAILGWFNVLGKWMPWCVGIAYLTGSSYAIASLVRSSNLLIRHRRGFRGELIVGFGLERLREHGYKVFHDIELERGNVDHVLVGQAGVFAVETKYARKHKRDDGHVLNYDGEKIRFPRSTSAKPVIQARTNAKELSEQLSGILGSVSVRPVLIFPGWYVKRRSEKRDLLVGNGKSLFRLFRLAPPSLPPERVTQIVRYFEMKCRDVEV